MTLENGKLKIRDGLNPTSNTAGFLYYNQVYRECPARELSPSSGYLCVSCNSAGTIGYSIEKKVPDLPILESASANDTAKFPIAEIKAANDTFTIRQILQYTPPYLTAWGPCD